MSKTVIRIVRVTALIFINLFVIGLVAMVHPTAELVESPPAQVALSKMGSRGDEVRTIQTKMNRWGYMNSPVDGIYGAATEKAVRLFQKKNGLTPDGIAGPATLRAMGIFESSGSGGSVGGYTDSDYQLLARIVSAEARGESYEGQVAVAAVVLNRVKHPSFPNTLAGVIYQPGAFTAINDGQIHQPVADSSKRAARDALNGWDASGGAIYYFNPDKTSDKWIRTRPVVKRIGNHLFCK